MPADLRTTGAELWTATLDRYELERHELVTLHQACRIADRLEQLAEESADAPMTVSDRKNDPVASPLVVESRQQSLTYARLIAALRLPDDGAGTRPQRRGGPRGVSHSGRKYGTVS